jgi:hypothetical protein
MDTSDTDITFDENGVSNHWCSCKERLQTEVVTGEAGLAKATEIAERIKEENRDRPYDCLIGVSGGVDSSTVAYWTRQLGLRAIETLLKTLDIDLHTEVLDWPEFRDLQRSFFFASVPNCEIPTDHAIVSTLFRLAHKLKIRHIISGSNVISEGVDQYDREAAIGTLAEEMGWRDYGRKHGESTFTRFFQEYYLPEKFGFDKRRMHFSSLICAGQMTREEALHKLEEPMYQEDELEAEIAFVCKKLQFTEREFSDIMNARPKQHTDYRTGMIFKWAKSPLFNWMRNVATERR